jgi:hypothetical protein
VPSGPASASTSRLASAGGFVVGDELAIEGVGDASLEAAHRLQRLLAGSQLAPVIRPAWGVQADLGAGDADDVVGLAVPGPGEPVPKLGNAGELSYGSHG